MITLLLPCSLVNKGCGRALHLKAGQGEALLLFGRPPRNSLKPWNAAFLTLMALLYFPFFNFPTWLILMNNFKMVHNGLESFHSKDGVLSLEVATEYLDLCMNCVDSKCPDWSLIRLLFCVAFLKLLLCLWSLEIIFPAWLNWWLELLSSHFPSGHASLQHFRSFGSYSGVSGKKMGDIAESHFR